MTTLAEIVTEDEKEWHGLMGEYRPQVVCGRPFGETGVLAEANVDANDLDDERARRWLKQGLGEHASIASFSAFALQLMANAAPLPLLSGAMRAGDDEVRHAEASFALASRFAGRDVRPGEFPAAAVGAIEPQSIDALARAALAEGGIAETLSVLDAAREYDETDDAQERTVLRMVVADELRHAALAWRTVVWASQVSPNRDTLLANLRRDVAAQAQSHRDFGDVIAPLAARLLSDNAVDFDTVLSYPDVEIDEQGSTLRDAAVNALLKTFRI